MNLWWDHDVNPKYPQEYTSKTFPLTVLCYSLPALCLHITCKIHWVLCIPHAPEAFGSIFFLPARDFVSRIPRCIYVHYYINNCSRKSTTVFTAAESMRQSHVCYVYEIKFQTRSVMWNLLQKESTWHYCMCNGIIYLTFGLNSTKPWLKAEKLED